MNLSNRGDPGEERRDPHLSEDTCLGLVLGLLSASEADALTAHIETCTACERLLKEQVIAHERQRARYEMEARPAGEGEQATGEEPTSWWARLGAAWRQPRFRWGLTGGLASAAAAALILLILLPGDPGETDADLLRWLPPHGGEKRIRTQASYAPSEQMLEGLEAYARRDVARASLLLRQAEATRPLDTMRRLYLASSLAWLGEYDEAAATLASLPHDLIPEPWSSESRWTLYVALNGSGRAASADSLLRILARKPGELGERAQRAIDGERDVSGGSPSRDPR